MLLGVILLGMITMRLAWIENRSYPTYLGALPWFDFGSVELALPMTQLCGYVPSFPARLGLSPLTTLEAFGTICHFDQVVDQSPKLPSESRLRQIVVDVNTTAMILTALVLGFCARLIGRSWLLASAIVAMLLSRGRWLSGLGQITDYYLWGLILACWLLSACYFFKTASRYPLAAGWLWLLGLSFSLPEAHLLFCALAIVWLVIYMRPSLGEVGPPRPIRLFGAVDLPVGQAVAVHRRQLRPLAWLAFAGILLSLTFYIRGTPLPWVNSWSVATLGPWYRALVEPIDIDLTIAMSAMVIVLILVSHRRFPLLRAAISLVVTAMALVITMSAWLALPSAQLQLSSYFNVILNPRYILPIFEPLLLMLGGLCLWRILHSFIEVLEARGTFFAQVAADQTAQKRREIPN